MKRPFIAVTALTLATAISFTSVAEERPASEKRLHTVQINSLEDLKAYFRYDPERDIIVSGHRGGMMPGYPENCIESCEKTLSMMPTFFEIDFSFTKDSVMVLMHDLTIDRTTNGKGRVADYTYEELQGFRLVDRDGKLTPYRIPRLKDMLEWGKDKVVFNFDNKYINTKGVSDEVRKASLDYYIRQLRPGGDWSMYHNIMLSVRSLDEAMYYWNAGIRNVMFCCEISSREMFDAYDACPIPWDYIMAYIRLSVDPRLQEVYDLLHERGVSTMTSITGSSDKVKNPRDRRVCYLRDLVSEPDLIETDYPSEFVDLPRSRAEIHALQDRGCLCFSEAAVSFQPERSERDTDAHAEAIDVVHRIDQQIVVVAGVAVKERYVEAEPLRRRGEDAHADFGREIDAPRVLILLDRVVIGGHFGIVGADTQTGVGLEYAPFEEIVSSHDAEWQLEQGVFLCGRHGGAAAQLQGLTADRLDVGLVGDEGADGDFGRYEVTAFEVHTPARCLVGEGAPQRNGHLPVDVEVGVLDELRPSRQGEGNRCDGEQQRFTTEYGKCFHSDE